MSDRPEKYYYYANERGCMKDLEAVDEIGVGQDPYGCLSIRLIRFRDQRGESPRFSMIASAHSDEWRVFGACRDVLDLLSRKAARSGETMTDMEPFYALRIHLEKLGYKNLGAMKG